jgi:exopolysaccharide biosynthesis polyprenyl glycosylphosphotransferase
MFCLSTTDTRPFILQTKSRVAMTRIFDNSLPPRMALLKGSELLLTILALPLTYRLRDGDALASVTTMDALAGFVGIVVFLCLYLIGFYEPAITIRPIHGVSCVMQATGLTLVVIGPLIETRVPVLSDIHVMLVGMLLIIAGLTTSRCLFAQVVQHSAFAEAAVVWGSGPLAAPIVNELQNRPDLGIRVVGVVDRSFSGETFDGVRFIGPPELLWSLAGSGQVRRLIVALEERRGSLPVERLMAAKANGVIVEYATELYEELTGKVWLGTFSEGELLFSRRFRSSAASVLLTRVFSVFFAAAALVVCLPIMLATAVLIWCESSGPIIFRQTRVGKNGRPFTMLKFRSMKVDSDGCAPATDDDPRCTRIGKWIRRFRIDEFPQLINILKGDMYLVGPRPFVPEQEELLVREIPFYRQRWAVCPGATGWAQVNRAYCSSLEDNIEKLSYDLFYIKNLSLTLDILVLFKTVRVVLLGRGGQ